MREIPPQDYNATDMKSSYRRANQTLHSIAEREVTHWRRHFATASIPTRHNASCWPASSAAVDLFLTIIAIGVRKCMKWMA